MDYEVPNKQIFSPFSAAFFPIKEKNRGEDTVCHQVWSGNLCAIEVGLATFQGYSWSCAANKNIKILLDISKNFFTMKTVGGYELEQAPRQAAWSPPLEILKSFTEYNPEQPALTWKLTLLSVGHWSGSPPEILSLLFRDSKYASGHLEMNLSLVIPLTSLNSI